MDGVMTEPDAPIENTVFDDLPDASSLSLVGG